jgi:N-terminal acetyltransferase B complex non-catalytic subunit
MKYGYGRPALKSSVDVQLQTAFSDGNWNSVTRLADKRAKSLKDPYYEAIKVSAESQLDGAADRGAVLNAIEELVKQKTVPDIDTIELYEWAAGDLIGEEIEYADTLGPLRVKWAKANPKSPLAMGCLQSCLEYWDLVSAQQVSHLAPRSQANLLTYFTLDFNSAGQGPSQLWRPSVYVLEHNPDVPALILSAAAQAAKCIAFWC